jgi:hypothetical protein
MKLEKLDQSGDICHLKICHQIFYKILLHVLKYFSINLKPQCVFEADAHTELFSWGGGGGELGAGPVAIYSLNLNLKTKLWKSCRKYKVIFL